MELRFSCADPSMCVAQNDSSDVIIVDVVVTDALVSMWRQAISNDHDGVKFKYDVARGWANI